MDSDCNFKTDHFPLLFILKNIIISNPNDKIMQIYFQWRIMSLAEFGFVSLTPGHSARHDYSDSNREANYKSDKQRQKEEKERKEREAQEEAARIAAEEKRKQEAAEAKR